MKRVDHRLGHMPCLRSAGESERPGKTNEYNVGVVIHFPNRFNREPTKQN